MKGWPRVKRFRTADRWTKKKRADGKQASDGQANKQQSGGETRGRGMSGKAAEE